MMFSYGLLHIAIPVLVEQHNLTFSNTLQTLLAVLITCQERWPSGTVGAKELMESVLLAFLNDYDIWSLQERFRRNCIYINFEEGARSTTVITAGNGISDTSLNPGWGCSVSLGANGLGKDMNLSVLPG